MQFPVWIELGDLRIHPHLFFESLAYLVGFQYYRLRKRRRGDVIESQQRWWIIAAAALGALLGSKLLVWLNDPVATWTNRNDPIQWLSGKTIVGGLIGGWIAVEFAKKRLGITVSTGDLFAPPLALAIAIGRIGCFLSGLPDKTHGTATSLPWGVDFGDAVARHPTQLYELAFLVALLGAMVWLERHAHRPGDVFKLFMVGYFTFRFLVEFIKPGLDILGLTILQWASLFVLVYYAPELRRMSRRAEVRPLDG